MPDPSSFYFNDHADIAASQRGKCIVKGCGNHKHQGKFIGDLCAPCHQYLTSGVVGKTTSFLGDLPRLEEQVKLLENACIEAVRIIAKSDPVGFAKWFREQGF